MCRTLESLKLMNPSLKPALWSNKNIFSLFHTWNQLQCSYGFKYLIMVCLLCLDDEFQIDFGIGWLFILTAWCWPCGLRCGEARPRLSISACFTVFAEWEHQSGGYNTQSWSRNWILKTWKIVIINTAHFCYSLVINALVLSDGYVAHEAPWEKINK